VGVWVFDYADIYDVIVYNILDCELAADEMIVPVSDHHTWKFNYLTTTNSSKIISER
jgi:hypothetical protein